MDKVLDARNKMIEDEELTKMRREINQLDNQLLHLLEARFEIIKRVGKYKKEKGLAIRDPDREKEVIQTKCGRTDLPDEFVEKLFRLIIDTAAEMEGEK